MAIVNPFRGPRQLPPYFAETPVDLVKGSYTIDVAVESFSPDLRVSVRSPIGRIPMYFDGRPLPTFGSYGEF